MRLIGLYDSPYVRRTAISLKLLGLDFRHEGVSVFRQYDTFAHINPVVKAPTLVLADGTVLMDSSLILEYAELRVPPDRRLTPLEPGGQVQALRIVGLALAACEKAVQIVYERELRPPEKQHEPWLERIQTQLLAACGLLEKEFGGDTWLFGRPMQADVTTAVAWRFLQARVADVVEKASYPGLVQLGARAEALPQFRSTAFS